MVLETASGYPMMPASAPRRPQSASTMNTVLQCFGRAILALAGFLYSHTSLNAQDVSGTLDPAFDVGIGVSGSGVNSIAVQPDGKIVLAGSFLAVNGQPRNCIARLLP